MLLTTEHRVFLVFFRRTYNLQDVANAFAERFLNRAPPAKAQYMYGKTYENIYRKTPVWTLIKGDLVFPELHELPEH